MDEKRQDEPEEEIQEEQDEFTDYGVDAAEMALQVLAPQSAESVPDDVDAEHVPKSGPSLNREQRRALKKKKQAVQAGRKRRF